MDSDTGDLGPREHIPPAPVRGGAGLARPSPLPLRNLTEERIREIYRERRDGNPVGDVARRFHVSTATVWLIDHAEEIAAIIRGEVG